MILSASYRTDIPAFYGEWFMQRLISGRVAWRNPYGGGLHHLDLLPEVVEAFVFWTRNPAPFFPVLEWLARPVPATAMALFILVNIWHARLGIQVVIEDYVHEHANKFAAITALNLLSFAGAAFGLFCVIRLALGGA